MGKKKNICLLGAICILLIGCSEKQDNQTTIQRLEPKVRQMEKEYDIAFKQAQNDDPKGLLKLYELASKSPSAELSEVARDVLHYFLHSKTMLWIKTFSKVNPTEFKKYIETGGLAVMESPGGTQSEELYHREIIKNLRSFNGSPAEMELAKAVLGAEEEIYKEITSKK